LSLHDMQRCNLRDAYSFILFHDKVAIQKNITYLLNISFIFLLGSHLSSIHYST
jgi:hypothetical protein